MLNAAVDTDLFAALREREFGRLDRQGLAYLDYTGSALYADSQIRTHAALLRERVFGNPHSDNRPSTESAKVIDAARHAVLRFFNADFATHDVCFTANATAAIKLVGESYPFAPDTPLVLSTDNHNSVNGVREFARRAGAPVRYLPLDGALRLRDAETGLEEEARGGGGLLAYPAQSNFSGVRHPLVLVERAKALGFDVLLDVAAFAPTQPLSLRECSADFVALSFYKLFGYPTGVGALIARREALARLRRPWFAGGTLLYASVQADMHHLRSGHEAFEDGTPSFLDIAALEAGFAILKEAGMERLSAHITALTEIFLSEMATLRHGNGASLVEIYGATDTHDRGGTVAFNVLDANGRRLPYAVVESAAARAGIALRGGCFCNPGAAEAALRLEAARTARCLQSLGDDFTIDRFGECHGQPVGAVRTSFGLATNQTDIHRAVALLATMRER
jgi:selenocysteine lyase/cysteine desulfurase